MKEIKEKNITVRFAREDELEQVNHIRKQVHELHCNGRLDFFKFNGWDAIKDNVKERFASEVSNVMVAYFENEIAGFAFVQYINKSDSGFRPSHSFCHIEEFGVDVKYRRHGIATLLIDFIKADALERGFKKLELNMWEFNESALAFYESVGFGTYRRDLEMFLTENESE